MQILVELSFAKVKNDSSFAIHSKVRSGCFPLYTVFYTFNIVTFLNQQVESLKRHHIKLELVINNFLI